MTNARFSILQARAVSDKNVSHSQFRTLAALGIFGDKDGWCFPKLTTLGEMLGKSKQAVSKDIQELVKHGYLQVKPQHREDGGRMHNLYRLLFDTPVNVALTPHQPDVDTPSTSEVDTPSTSEVDALTPHKNAPRLREPLTASQYKERVRNAIERGRVRQFELEEAIQKNFHINPDWDNKRNTRFMQWLKTVSEDQTVEKFREWWYSEDWRGKDGQPPTLDQIRELWPQAFSDAPIDPNKPMTDEEFLRYHKLGEYAEKV